MTAVYLIESDIVSTSVISFSAWWFVRWISRTAFTHSLMNNKDDIVATLCIQLLSGIYLKAFVRVNKKEQSRQMIWVNVCFIFCWVTRWITSLETLPPSFMMLMNRLFYDAETHRDLKGLSCPSFCMTKVRSSSDLWRKNPIPLCS